MSKQPTFASMALAHKGNVTRREQLMAAMDAVIPWARLLAPIEPHYPKAGEAARCRIPVSARRRGRSQPRQSSASQGCRPRPQMVARFDLRAS